jgi:hypothetical protein
MTKRASSLLAIAVAACGGGGGSGEPDATAGADAVGPTTCGEGTILDGEECVVAPAAPYQLRIAESVLGANGHTRRAVMAFGTNPDGTPATARVVVGIDRASAGTFSRRSLDMGPTGAVTYFTPCDAASPDCVGPATLTLALAADPTTIVAETHVDLVAPTGVSSLAPCIDVGNVVYYDGNDYVRYTMDTIREATWQFKTLPSEIVAHVVPLDWYQVPGWNFSIDTGDKLVPLAPGTFDVQRFHNPNDAPGLYFTGPRGCNTITGRLHIAEVEMLDGEVRRLTAAFEQHCEGGPAMTEGCIHYEAP